MQTLRGCEVCAGFVDECGEECPRKAQRDDAWRFSPTRDDRWWQCTREGLTRWQTLRLEWAEFLAVGDRVWGNRWWRLIVLFLALGGGLSFVYSAMVWHTIETHNALCEELGW